MHWFRYRKPKFLIEPTNESIIISDHGFRCCLIYGAESFPVMLEIINISPGIDKV